MPARQVIAVAVCTFLIAIVITGTVGAQETTAKELADCAMRDIRDFHYDF